MSLMKWLSSYTHQGLSSTGLIIDLWQNHAYYSQRSQVNSVPAISTLGKTSMQLNLDKHNTGDQKPNRQRPFQMQ